MRKIRCLIKSFTYAFHGIGHAIIHERNMRIHLTAALLVTEFAVIYGLEAYEYALLFLLFGLVIAAELFNTAIEALVDLNTQDYHPLAKISKDVAAGAVLILAIASVIIGGFLFFHLEKLRKMFLFLQNHPILIVIGIVEIILAGFFIFCQNDKTKEKQNNNDKKEL